MTTNLIKTSYSLLLCGPVCKSIPISFKLNQKLRGGFLDGGLYINLTDAIWGRARQEIMMLIFPTCKPSLISFRGMSAEFFAN